MVIDWSEWILYEVSSHLVRINNEKWNGMRCNNYFLLDHNY